MVEERQLRYLGHVWRFGPERWTKFALECARPGQKNTGRARQYRKTMSKLLSNKGLTTSMMLDRKGWASKLEEILPRGKKDHEAAQELPPSNQQQQ